MSHEGFLNFFLPKSSVLSSIHFYMIIFFLNTLTFHKSIGAKFYFRSTLIFIMKELYDMLYQNTKNNLKDSKRMI